MVAGNRPDSPNMAFVEVDIFNSKRPLDITNNLKFLDLFSGILNFRAIVEYRLNLSIENFEL